MLWLISLAIGSSLPCPEGAFDRWRQESLTCPRCTEGELDQILKANPTCSEAALARAALHHGHGEVELALEVLKAADHDDPRVVVAHAVAAHRAGLDATELLRDAIKHSPEDPLLIRYQATRMPMAERVRYLSAAQDRLRWNEGLTVDLIDAYAQAGRPSAALELGRSSFERHPSPAIGNRVADLLAIVPIGADEAFVHIADDDLEEVVVYSVAGARRRLEARLRELGYGPGRRTSNGTRYPATKNMMPWVELRDNGTVEVQRRGIVPRSPVPGVLSLSKLGIPNTGAGLAATNPMQLASTPLEQRGPANPTLGITFNGIVSKRKLANSRERVLQHLQPAILTWRRALAEQTFSRAVEARLPPALDALWSRGEPLSGRVHLSTFAHRRAALEAFWTSRTCSPEGERARSMTIAFIRQTVSPTHPYSEAELSRAANACGVSFAEALKD